MSPSTPDKEHRDVNLGCTECDGFVRLTIYEEYVDLKCTRCGEGDVYARFKGGETTINGSERKC